MRREISAGVASNDMGGIQIWVCFPFWMQVRDIVRVTVTVRWRSRLSWTIWAREVHEG